jgi:hypothetical protein
MYIPCNNEYKIFKLIETTIRKGLREKKNRGDKPILAIIHIYVDAPQGNSLCSYLKPKKSHFLIL